MTTLPYPHTRDEQVSVDADNPWPGLASFQEADRAFFHGRESETDELFRLTRRDRLTVLFGVSGLGKTSLLRAGLFPRLRQAGDILPVYLRLSHTDGSPRPTEQVIQALAEAAAAENIEAPAARDGDTLWEFFHRVDAQFWTSRNRVALPLIVLDQFEEILTIGRHAPERAAASADFLDELCDLVEGRPPDRLMARLEATPADAEQFAFERHDYAVVLSLREDFLAELDGLRSRMRSLDQNRLRLRRMGGEQARRVLVESGQHLLDDGAADGIVRFVAGASANDALSTLEVEPALLSLVCRELNEKRLHRRQPRITLALLEGSRNEILTGFYKRSVEGVPRAVRTLVEERMLTRSGFRDSMAYEDVLAIPGVTEEAIRRLVDGRLLRLEDRNGVQRLELTHDVLTGVVAASRERRRARDETAKAIAAQREAEERELEVRRKLRQSRIATGSAAAIGFASLLAISFTYIFIAPTIQAAAASVNSPLNPLTRALLPVLNAVTKWWPIGVIAGGVAYWALRRHESKGGRTQASRTRQLLAAGALPILALLTIISLAWINSVALDYAITMPGIPTAWRGVYITMLREASMERFRRTGQLDSVIVRLRRQLSDTQFGTPVVGGQFTIEVAYYSLLLAEALRTKGDSAASERAYDDAIAAARSEHDSTWIRLIEDSRKQTGSPRPTASPGVP